MEGTYLRLRWIGTQLVKFVGLIRCQCVQCRCECCLDVVEVFSLECYTQVICIDGTSCFGVYGMVVSVSFYVKQHNIGRNGSYITWLATS